MLKTSYPRHRDERNLNQLFSKAPVAPVTDRCRTDTTPWRDPGFSKPCARIFGPLGSMFDFGQVTEKGEAPVGAPAASMFTHKAVVSTSTARKLVLLEKWDRASFLHSLSVAHLMTELALACGCDHDTSSEIYLGGLLHDYGKIRIPTELINKAGPLTAGEMALIHLHPIFGYDLLVEEDDVPATVLDICLHHHERLDGSGYPDGLTGEDIDLPVRISAICDVYDALTTDRPYKKALPASEAKQLMMKQSRQFDIDLLALFFDVILQAEDVG